MSQVNHYLIGEMLRSQVVGPANLGHGQIASLAGAQKYFDSFDLNQPSALLHGDEFVDTALVKKAFLTVRTDHGSTELYVADPVRNARFLKQCRKLGIRASDYKINKTLFNARKNKLLPGLGSDRTPSHHQSFAFACEFAATELRYTKGASIDDIVCDPRLAAEYDSIAGRISPGHSSFEYRWGILSIRKAGRHNKSKKQTALTPPVKVPDLVAGFRLTVDPIDIIPEESGVYLLAERQNPLYVSTADSLRQGVAIYRQPTIIAALTDKFWRPKEQDFTVAYAPITQQAKLKAIEKRIIEEWRPVFNVPRLVA